LVTTFYDDFNSPTHRVDTRKWTTNYFGSSSENYVIDQEVTTPGNAPKGVLRLRIDQNFPANGKSSISTAGVCSACAPNCPDISRCANSFTQVYGQFEIRAKFGTSPGYVPAFWLFPLSQNDQADADEIDIFEHPGSNPFHQLLTVFFGKNERRFTKSTSVSFPQKDFTRGFHVFTLDWRPEMLTWLVDG
jgi:hypothetical protein